MKKVRRKTMMTNSDSTDTVYITSISKSFSYLLTYVSYYHGREQSVWYPILSKGQMIDIIHPVQWITKIGIKETVVLLIFS